MHTSIRYYFFEKWASLYSSRALLLVTDFRGVIFQSDPFSYRRQEWFPDHQLAVFQEFHPNMVIGRCSFQRSVLLECFGDDALRLYVNRVAISAGAFIGSRDGMLVWAHHMTMVRAAVCVSSSSHRYGTPATDLMRPTYTHRLVSLYSNYKMLRAAWSTRAASTAASTTPS